MTTHDIRLLIEIVRIVRGNEISTDLADELTAMLVHAEADLRTTNEARELCFARVILAQQIDVTGEVRKLAEDTVARAKLKARGNKI